MIFVFLAFPFLSGCAGSATISEGPPDAEVTYQVFYDNLSPYGTWIDYPSYGHVWTPRVNGDFRPYVTNGYWTFSTGGWAWASGYPWGWAVFHYGSWLYDDSYGWLWVPGYVWSPAWVTWGWFDDYYCWAPLMPGVPLDARWGSWRPHSFYWNVCGRDHIYDRDLSRAIVGRQVLDNNLGRISIIDNFAQTRSHGQFYSKGPEVGEVQRYVNRRIDQVTIRDAGRADDHKESGRAMNLYRPRLQAPEVPDDQRLRSTPGPLRFKSVQPEQASPMFRESQQPSRQFMEQRTNVERLPMHQRGR